MGFYDDESSSEEDNLHQAREKEGSEGFREPEHSNGRVFRSAERITKENSGRRFLHGSDGEGSYDNMNEKDGGYNTNRPVRNSMYEHPRFQSSGHDSRDSDSEVDRGERNYLQRSKHIDVYKSNDNDSMSEDAAGDEDYGKETNRDDDFVVSEGEDGNMTYNGRYRNFSVSEKSDKSKGKGSEANIRANSKRESTGRGKYMQPQIEDDNFEEEDEVEEVDGKEEMSVKFCLLIWCL
jgi:hypothetical protein